MPVGNHIVSFRIKVLKLGLFEVLLIPYMHQPQKLAIIISKSESHSDDKVMLNCAMIKRPLVGRDPF